jgi:hypothetical protein
MTTVENLDRFNIDAYEKICDVVKRAMDGSAEGDVQKLRQAYHDEARMFGEAYGQRYDDPICSFFELCQSHPLRGKNNLYRFKIVSVSLVGGAAMVMVAEDGCWDTASFVDFFTVTCINGAWKITNKTFVYTGGEIPQEVLD